MSQSARHAAVACFKSVAAALRAVMAAAEEPELWADKMAPSTSDTVAGVSCGCADVFGADDQGLARITTNAVPGTTGLPSLLGLQRDGFQVLTF